MPEFLKIYGDTEGPLGFPMKDADARALDALMQQHPEAEFHRVVVEKATTELNDGERADVSWIQTELIDRVGEIVLAAGFRDDVFKANPIVTINHDYTRSPIGRSIWRRRMKDGTRHGVKAKTSYPAKPSEWPTDQIWPSDVAWSLVKSGLMGGKSIGFLTIEAHAPTDDEVKRRPELRDVRRIVDEWMLLEYCCCWLPINPEAVVEATSKAQVEVLGIPFPEITPKAPPTFTTLDQFQSAIDRALKSFDAQKLADKLVQDAVDRMKGRV